jgi:uncharacterized protein YrrD
VDLGPPASYLSIGSGAPVFSSDGQKLGEVEHVLADADADIFDGLVIDTTLAPGGHRFADALLVDEVFERGVVLNVPAAEAERLPEPTANPATVAVEPDDVLPDDLGDKLRRAWDLISGRY